MFKDIVYMLSLTVLPQTWKREQTQHGYHFLMAAPSPYDPVMDEVVGLEPQGDLTMGEPEEFEPDDDVIMAQAEVLEDFEEDSEADSEGLAFTGEPIIAGSSASSVEGLAPMEVVSPALSRAAAAEVEDVLIERVFGCTWKPTDPSDIQLSRAQDVMDAVQVKHPQIRRYDPAWLDESLTDVFSGDHEWPEGEIPWLCISIRRNISSVTFARRT
jgi:hypothetical protein